MPTESIPKLEKDFIAFVPIQKSFESSDGEWYIEGPVSSEREDFDGEILERSGVMKGLEVFQNLGGVVDWDHQYQKTHDLKYIVGQGVKIYEKDGLPWLVTRLFKEKPLAQEIWNHLHVHKGILGYSIEGISRRDPVDPRKIIETKIYTVSVTPIPKNYDSRVHILPVLKSVIQELEAIPPFETPPSLSPQKDPMVKSMKPSTVTEETILEEVLHNMRKGLALADGGPTVKAITAAERHQQLGREIEHASHEWERIHPAPHPDSYAAGMRKALEHARQLHQESSDPPQMLHHVLEMHDRHREAFPEPNEFQTGYRHGLNQSLHLASHHAALHPVFSWGTTVAKALTTTDVSIPLQGTTGGPALRAQEIVTQHLHPQPKEKKNQGDTSMASKGKTSRNSNQILYRRKPQGNPKKPGVRKALDIPQEPALAKAKRSGRTHQPIAATNTAKKDPFHNVADAFAQIRCKNCGIWNDARRSECRKCGRDFPVLPASTWVAKGYVGFDKLEKKLAGRGVNHPGAVAASIGRKKYGKKRFQEAAAKGKSLRGSPVKKSAPGFIGYAYLPKNLR